MLAPRTRGRIPLLQPNASGQLSRQESDIQQGVAVLGAGETLFDAGWSTPVQPTQAAAVRKHEQHLQVIVGTTGHSLTGDCV
jgi:hypothetical protein